MKAFILKFFVSFILARFPGVAIESAVYNHCAAGSPLCREGSGCALEGNISYKRSKTSSSGHVKSLESAAGTARVRVEKGFSWEEDVEEQSEEGKLTGVLKPALQASCPRLQYTDSLNSCTMWSRRGRRAPI